MFARTNFVQNSLTKVVQNRGFKTDKELLEEIKNEGIADLTNLEDEFGDNPYWKVYGQFVDWCRQMTYQGGKYETPFTILIILTIILAGVLVGLDTYEQLQDIVALNILEILIVVIFVIEIVIKICAEGTKPWKFFTDGEAGLWNTFDFLVVVFSMPFLSSLFKETPAIRIVSRLFRLIRVTKIVNQIPALQVIVKGLVGGIKSIVYVVMLLLLIFYMYAVFGVFMFKENDPFFFRDISIALLTLFRVCTLENWGDNMYINMYGCKEFDGDIYLSIDLTPAEEWEALPHFYRCATPKPRYVLSIFYFLSFITISSLVMLSLFIGVITMSMQESLNDMRREVEEANRKKRLLKAEEEMEKMALKNTAMLITQRMGGTVNLSSKGRKRADDLEFDSESESESSSSDDEDDETGKRRSSIFVASMTQVNKAYRKMRRKSTAVLKHAASAMGINGRRAMSTKEKKRLRDLAEMKSLMMQAWSGTKISADYHHELDTMQEGTLEKYMRHAGMYSRRVIENPHFTNSITGVILFTAVLVGVETDWRNDDNATFFDVTENIIFGIFAAEVVLRFAAEDFHVKEYFKSSWNTFDFLVVALSKVPGGGTVIVLLRLVRLLRVLKLVKSLPQLSVIVSALLMGISSIGYISVIMLLTFYLFGILGVMLFRENDDFNFGVLDRALIALFKIATLDAWGDALYINFYGCDTYPPYFINKDEMFRCPNSSPNAAATVIFFTFFVLIGALVMITLFVGVVTTSMEEATRLQMVEFEIESRIRELCNERSVTPSQLDIYRRVFAMLDLDGGGTIEGEELRLGLQAVNIECNDEQLENWMKEVDENSDGVIDLIEFIIFMTNMKKKAMEEQEAKAMRKGADAFLRMRAKAQARKKGLLPEKVVPVEASPPVAAPKRRGSIFSMGGGGSGTTSFFSSGDTSPSKYQDNKETPSFLQRMGTSIGFNMGDTKSSQDDVQDASAFGSAEKKPKEDVQLLEKPKAADTPSPGSSDGADVTAELTEDTSMSMKIQPLDAEDMSASD
jgi:voltage-gated sodium channel